MSDIGFTPGETGGIRMIQCSPDGTPLRDENDALKLIGAAFENGAKWVVIPAGRLGDGFFDLSTRIAGGFIQKFVTYRIGLAILGNISGYTADSRALRDFVYECNKGDYLWFVNDTEEFTKRLIPR